MLLSEAKRILKKNGYVIEESLADEMRKLSKSFDPDKNAKELIEDAMEQIKDAAEKGNTYCKLELFIDNYDIHDVITKALEKEGFNVNSNKSMNALGNGSYRWTPWISW